MCAHTLTNTDTHSLRRSLAYSRAYTLAYTLTLMLAHTFPCTPTNARVCSSLRSVTSACEGFWEQCLPERLSDPVFTHACARIDVSSAWMLRGCSAYRVASLDRDPQCQCDQSGVLGYRKRATREATVASLRSRWHPRSVKQEVLVTPHPET